MGMWQKTDEKTITMWRVLLFTNILIAPSTCGTYKVRTENGKEHIVKARKRSKLFPDLELGKNHIVPAAKIASDYYSYNYNNMSNIATTTKPEPSTTPELTTTTKPESNTTASTACTPGTKGVQRPVTIAVDTTSSMTAHFPFVKKTFEKIADSGPNIPLWNLVDFADPDAIHRISTADVNQFKTAVQALAIRDDTTGRNDLPEAYMTAVGKALEVTPENGMILVFGDSGMHNPSLWHGHFQTSKAKKIKIFWIYTPKCHYACDAQSIAAHEGLSEGRIYNTADELNVNQFFIDAVHTVQTPCESESSGHRGQKVFSTPPPPPQVFTA